MYRSIVTRMSEWRRILCTAAGFAPNITSSEAVVCLVSYQETSGHSHHGLTFFVGAAKSRENRIAWMWCTFVLDTVVK